MATLTDAIRRQRQHYVLESPTEKVADTTSSTGSLSVALTNTTTSSTCYAYITGLDPSQDNAVFILESDGKTGYYPTSPSSTDSPLAVDCSIPLGAPGSTVTATIPYLTAGRIWFCEGSELTFYLNPGPALVEPSVTNTSDPNYNLSWSFIEFTYSSTELFANITYVDFVCMPISLTVEDTSGDTQTVEGIPSDGLASVCTMLQEQDDEDGAGWSKLIVTDSSTGATIRALSPNSGIVMDSTLFDGYYSSYVDDVWTMYESSTLTVDTQDTWGNVTAEVSSNELTFSGVGSYSQPAAADIFSCSSGPFAVSTSDEVNNITARLAAAFNRSTLLIDSNQPDGEVVSDYYQNSITNHYARIVHAVIPDGNGYAFPYDDVEADSADNVAGVVVSTSPSLFTCTFGGLSSSSSTTSRRTTTVPVGQFARSGGAGRQQVGGSRIRRSLTPPPYPSAEDEKALLAARDADAEALADLEKGLSKLGGPEPAPTSATQLLRSPGDGLAAAVGALVRRVPAAGRVAPFLEALARAAAEALRVSEGTVIGRAVVVAVLVLASFVLGLFWPEGGRAVGAHAAAVVV